MDLCHLCGVVSVRLSSRSFRGPGDHVAWTSSWNSWHGSVFARVLWSGSGRRAQENQYGSSNNELCWSWCYSGSLESKEALGRCLKVTNEKRWIGWVDEWMGGGGWTETTRSVVYPIHMSLVLAFASGSSWPWCLGTEKSGTNSGSSLCGLKSNLDENKKQTKTTNRGKGRGFACVLPK